jgi:hypothetical protein
MATGARRNPETGEWEQFELSEEEHPLPTPLPEPPITVSPAQAKIALHRAGLLSQVETLVAADPELKIWYDNATQWIRTDPNIVAMGAALSLTEQQIDELFVAAQGVGNGPPGPSESAQSAKALPRRSGRGQRPTNTKSRRRSS